MRHLSLPKSCHVPLSTEPYTELQVQDQESQCRTLRECAL